MNDILLEISRNPQARKVIQSLGLPIPLPPELARAKGPYEDRPLEGGQVAVGSSPGATLGAALAEVIVSAGGEPVLFGSQSTEAWYAAGEAYGRPVRVANGEAPEGFAPQALVFDASGIDEVSGLRSLYDFFHPLMSRLRRSGRVVVLGRPPESSATPEGTAAQAGLEGFVRSVAKEVGRRGATAHVVYVEPGAEKRLAGVLRFLLSRRSVFVSGQPFRVSARAAGHDENLPWVRPLENKVVLVTGAARGIGEATSRILAAEGAKVVCLDRPADDGPTSALAREIGGSVLLCDIGAPDAPKKIAGELKERFGGVDVVVHNAGITRDKTLGKMKEEYWDQAVDINLGAVVRITDELLGGTLRDGGRVVCLSSVAGIAGNMGQTNYSASKAGIVGFVRGLSEQVAPRGITVNAVAPGFIETRLTAAIPFMIREAGRRLSNLGQGGRPEDVGQLITFLATPGAQGLTGQVVRVCGGALIGA